MEGEEQRRRQHEHSRFPRGPVPPARPRSDDTTNIHIINRAQDLANVERYRPIEFMSSQPPSSTTISVNASAQNEINFGTYPTSQPYNSAQLQGHANPFQYQAEYTQDPQRQQAFPQQFSSQLVYNTPHQQGPQQTTFDPVLQYPSRPSVASDALPHQFGDAQFFNPVVGGSSSAPTAATSQFPTAPYRQPAQYTSQSDLERPSIASHYVESQSDLAQPQAMSPDRREPDRYELFHSQYQQTLKATNENTSRGRLVEAGASLLEISRWLLGNADGLELTKDNQAVHQDRLKLWKDFNYCWLAFLTRQLDDSKRVQATGRKPGSGESLLSNSALQRLGDELTRLCDGLEKSGLVDYEMGVWEEEIIHWRSQA